MVIYNPSKLAKTRFSVYKGPVLLQFSRSPLQGELRNQNEDLACVVSQEPCSCVEGSWSGDQINHGAVVAR